MTLHQILAPFQATGRESSFHGRHKGAQILAELDGSNWGIEAYQARGGYQSAREYLPGPIRNCGNQRLARWIEPQLQHLEPCQRIRSLRRR